MSTKLEAKLSCPSSSTLVENESSYQLFTLSEGRRTSSTRDEMTPASTVFDLELQKPPLEPDFSEKCIDLRLKHLTQTTENTLVPNITNSIKAATWFTPYRQLFTISVILNSLGVILEMTGHWNWAKDNLTTLVVGNILLAVSVRSEWILRLLYWVSVKTFRPTMCPLWIRVKVVGIVYHIGGVHSGSGLSALLWQIVAAYEIFQNDQRYSTGGLTALTICVACLLLTCVSALPAIRGSYHNSFEIVHRFVGWAGILSTISFVVMRSLWDPSRHRYDGSLSRLIFKPELVLLLAICVIIIFAWITTAKVPVIIYTASKKASVIRFPGGLTSGLHTRISVGGLREWHIFGSISEGKNSECHYIVAAVQGEFTKMLNVEKPQTLYTKLWKPCGLPYFSRMFKRGVAICSGSGIGAVGSTCIQHDNWFLIWIGADLQKTYGNEIMELICDRIPAERRLIWDTRGPLGRPNVVRLLQETCQFWQAEVNLFIGSPALNKEVLTSCRALKIPVFGSIWDA